MPIAEIIDIIDQVLAGLAHAHENQITHRDIKPDNVMLLARGTGRLVKILNECISFNPPEGVTIAIGSELGIPSMRDFTFITSSYASNDRTTGFLGIIGPTRMEYERGISLVGYLGRIVGEMINA